MSSGVELEDKSVNNEQPEPSNNDANNKVVDQVEEASANSNSTHVDGSDSSALLDKDSVAEKLNADRGIPMELASILAELVAQPTGLFSLDDIDERAATAVKDLDAEFVRLVVDELAVKDYTNITNKSACLCGLVKQLKLKRQQQQAGGDAAGRRGSSNASSTVGAPSTPGALPTSSGASAGAEGSAGVAAKLGPDETKLKELLAEIGFCHELTVGQRRLGPPNGAEELKDSSQCEIFVGKLPKDMYEDQIYKMFRPVGPIYDIRVMVDPPTGMGRGFCFVCYTNRQDAAEAVKKFHEYEIKPARRLQVNLATPNLRLFVGNIPKTFDRAKLLEDFSRVVDGVVDVIVYGSPDDTRKKNRGFCFLEFDKHSSASAARRKLMKYPRVWSSDVWVDWADPLEEPDPDTMAKVRVLYVKSLTMDVTEDRLQEAFSVYGPLERVKKVKDYGFVHFEERDDALRAMEKLNGSTIGRSGPLSVTLAKPVSERAKQRKEERRMRGVALPAMAPPVAPYHPAQPGAYHHHPAYYPPHHPAYATGPAGAPWAAPGGAYGPGASEPHHQHHQPLTQPHQHHPAAGYPAASLPDHSGGSSGPWAMPGDHQLYYPGQQPPLPPLAYQPHPHHQLTSPPPLPQQQQQPPIPPQSHPHLLHQAGSIAAAAPSGRMQRGGAGGSNGGRPYQYPQPAAHHAALGRGHVRSGGGGGPRPPYFGSTGRNGGAARGSNPRPQTPPPPPPAQ